VVKIKCSNPKTNPEYEHSLENNISHISMPSLISEVIFLKLEKGKSCISFEAVLTVVLSERKVAFKAYIKDEFWTVVGPLPLSK
jgi:hypothetical protein